MKESAHVTSLSSEGTTVVHYKDYIHYCHVVSKAPCRNVITEHMLVYIYSGALDVYSENRTYHLHKGDAYILRRNHLNNKEAKPLDNGEPFEGIFIYFTVPMLREVIAQHGISLKNVSPYQRKSPYIPLPRHAYIGNLFASLLAYFKAEHFPDERLMDLKMQEIILTLLEIKPELKALLFDFALSSKVDLPAFMEQCYLQNYSVAELAHHAGCSLATFRKDFLQTFHTTPGRWILSRRLTEARRLIEEEGRKPVEVYLLTGFKTLSHFSRAFKEKYGMLPSSLSSR